MQVGYGKYGIYFRPPKGQVYAVLFLLFAIP